MALRDELLAAADAYCAAHGLTRSALGNLLLRDNKFFVDVAAGRRGFTIRTYERVMDGLKRVPRELNNGPESRKATA